MSLATAVLRFDVNWHTPDFRLSAQGCFDQPHTVIMGDSGAGKSSLLILLAGLRTPLEGHIGLDEQVLFDRQNKVNVAPEHRRIGLMWQDGQLFPHLNVRQNLRFGYQRHADAVHIDFDQVVERFGIASLLARSPRHLSGGERQRIALARTILAAPKILLLDEPLTALDPVRRADLLQFIADIPKQFGIACVMISHQPQDAVDLGAQLFRCESGILQRADR